MPSSSAASRSAATKGLNGRMAQEGTRGRVGCTQRHTPEAIATSSKAQTSGIQRRLAAGSADVLGFASDGRTTSASGMGDGLVVKGGASDSKRVTGATKR